MQWLDQIATKFGFYDVFDKDLVRLLQLSWCFFKWHDLFPLTLARARFPQVIVSQTVRSAKPAKAIYEVTLAKLREELGEDLQASEVR